MFSRVDRAVNYLLRGPAGLLTENKALQFRVTPIVLPLITAGALTYHYGQRKRDAHPDQNDWKTVLIESAIGAFLLEQTQGIYSSLSILYAAFKAGDSPDLPSAIKAFAGSLTVFLTGFIGATAGNVFFAQGLDQWDMKETNRLLHAPVVKPIASASTAPTTPPETLLTTLKGLPDEAIRSLSGKLETLSREIQKFYGHLRSTAYVSVDQLSAAQEKILALQADIFKVLTESLNPKVVATKLSHQEGLVRNWYYLVEAVSNSQTPYIRASRLISPMCCFLLASFVVAPKIVREVNGLLDYVIFPKLAPWLGLEKGKRPPSLISPHPKTLFGPLSHKIQSAVNVAATGHFNLGGGHGSGHGGSIHDQMSLHERLTSSH